MRVDEIIFKIKRAVKEYKQQHAFTKTQRYEAYKWMHEHFDACGSSGFCNRLSYYRINNKHDIYLHNCPELLKYRPKDFKFFWFATDEVGLGIRRSILRDILIGK